MAPRVGRPSDVELAPFGIRLRSLIEASDEFKNRAAFLRAVGVDGPTCYFWEKELRLPNAQFLLDAAAKLGVSTDYLLGRSTAGGPNPYLEWERFLEYAEQYGFGMTDEEQATLAAIRLPAGLAPDRQWYMGVLNSIRMLSEEEADPPSKQSPRSPGFPMEDSSPDIRR